MAAEGAQASSIRAEGRGDQLTLARDVCILGVVWGSSVVFQRMAVAELEPLPLGTLRLVAASAFFLPFLPRVRRGLSDPRRLRDIGVVGAINPALCGILATIALQFASSGLVAVLISLGPLLTALIAKVTLDEPPLGRRQMAGLGLAFAGVAFLIATRSTGLATQAEGGGGWGDLRGHAFALAIALAMAVSSVYNRRTLQGTDPLAMAAGQNWAGLLIIAPLTLWLAEPTDLGAISGQVWMAVIVSGTIGLGASFILFQAMIARHGATAAMLALYIMPIVAAVMGALVLGETIGLPMAGGAALVLAGVVLFTRRGGGRRDVAGR